MNNEAAQIVLTSVVISAIISSVISGIFLILNEIFRKKSDEKKLKFEAALKLTKMRDEQIGEILKRTDRLIRWPAPLKTFSKTFKSVEKIWNGNYEENDNPIKVN